MAGRGRSTFQKRQKEQTRLQRREQKAARKMERKAGKDSPDEQSDQELQQPALIPEDGEPQLSDGTPAEGDSAHEPARSGLNGV